jgi:hypothetical protein
VPPPALSPKLERRRQELASDLDDIEVGIDEQRQVVRALELDLEALRESAYSSALHEQTAVELRVAETELTSRMARRNALTQKRDAVSQYAERVAAGASDDPRAHLVDAHRPAPPANARGVLQLWAALSGGVALLAVALLLVVFPSHLWFWALVVGVAFALVEATAEGRLLKFLLGLTVVLAVITALILIREHWRIAIVLVLGVVIAIMTRDNLRELKGS